jgi:hypothetical protein
MAGLQTHKIQSLTLLRLNQIGRPRLVYTSSDNGSFYQDTLPIVLPGTVELLVWGWQLDCGDSSAPLFARVVLNLTTEGFLQFGKLPVPVRMISPKTKTSFVDPSIPTRFRFSPLSW